MPGQINPISLVQDFEFGFDLSREEVKSIGYDQILKPIVSNQRPVFSFSYYLSDIDNEKLFRMPVTAEAAILDKIPLFTGLEPFDFFFLSNPETQDFKDYNESDLSACVFINSSLNTYEFNLERSGIIKVSVSFEAENVLFKKFNSIKNYEVLEYDREDLNITNRNIFQINNGVDEINLNTGGFSTQERVNAFNFSASIGRKILYDFGQYAHKKEIIYPVRSNVSIQAFVSEQISGRLDNIICDDRSTDFILSNSRATCEDPNLQDDKSGLAIIGAKLKSQNYSLSVSKGDYLITNLNFEIDVPKTFNGTGIFLTQHITQSGAVIVSEGGQFKSVILEDGSGGRILTEVALDMFQQLRELQGG